MEAALKRGLFASMLEWVFTKDKMPHLCAVFRRNFFCLALQYAPGLLILPRNWPSLRRPFQSSQRGSLIQPTIREGCSQDIMRF